jgi:hypothetical protein
MKLAKEVIRRFERFSSALLEHASSDLYMYK